MKKALFLVAVFLISCILFYGCDKASHSMTPTPTPMTNPSPSPNQTLFPSGEVPFFTLLDGWVMDDEEWVVYLSARFYNPIFADNAMSDIRVNIHPPLSIDDSLLEYVNRTITDEPNHECIEIKEYYLSGLGTVDIVFFSKGHRQRFIFVADDVSLYVISVPEEVEDENLKEEINTIVATFRTP